MVPKTIEDGKKAIKAAPANAGPGQGEGAAGNKIGIDTALVKEIVERDPASLKINPKNARTHSQRQIKQLAKSIEAYGFNNPILLDPEGRVVAGHGRLVAALLLGLKLVPTIDLKHLSPDQIRAYTIADNRFAELAGWDETALALELQYLSELDVTIDTESLGFETAELDALVDRLDERVEREDRLPELPASEPRTSRLGDLWLLGPHRLLCGNALEADDFERLMAGQKADMIFADVPYNVPIDGHVGGRGRVKHENFVMASGEMSKAEYTEFLIRACRHFARYSRVGSLHFICQDWRHLAEMAAAGGQAYTEHINLCVWTKANAGLGGFYRSQHELVFVYQSGQGGATNNVMLGRFGRNRSNVWKYPGITSMSAERDELLAMHPTVKPVDLVADAIKDCTKRRDVVLDSFVGSGTTIIAAQKTGRIAYAMELDPKYVDTAIRRWEDYAGKPAQHAVTGLAFAEMARNRQAARDEMRELGPAYRGGHR